MLAGGPPARLRDRFDEARHPPAQGRPLTHHRDYYLATDGSVGPDGGRLGAVLETIDGVRVGAWSRTASVADNNDAELQALHWGLDLLAARSPPDSTVGVLLDHDVLGEVLARAVGRSGYRLPPSPIPSASRHHWGGILARITQCESVGVAVVTGKRNPAHAVANRGGRPFRTWRDRCVRAATPAELRAIGGAAAATWGSTDAT